MVPKKAPNSQKKDAQLLIKLLEFFDDPPGPMNAIEPQHVYQFMLWRSSAPISANRAKALLSHMWNYARKKGYTKLANPCTGISGNPESGRDVYIEDDLYLLVYQHADVGLQDAMDLAYLTGQRPGDVLAMDERDIRDGVLHVRQSKTKAKRRIVIEGALAALLDRIKARKAGMKVRPTKLVVSESGMVMSKYMLRDRFDLARERAGIEKSAFQLR